MVTALRSWCTTRIGVVLIGAVLTTLCASQRLANGLGRDSALSAAGVWSVFIVSMCAYAVLFFLGLALIHRLSSKAASALLIALIVGLGIAFVIVYPLLGAPTDGSGFGDRDDALTLMGKALFSGENPFTVQTYLGGQVSPLLGVVIFAAPATVIAGSAAWMNLVLIIVLGYVAWKFLPPRIGLALSLVVVTNVGFLEDFLLGGDAFLYPLAFAAVSWALLHSTLNLSKPSVVGLVVVGGLLGAASQHLDCCGCAPRICDGERFSRETPLGNRHDGVHQRVPRCSVVAMGGRIGLVAVHRRCVIKCASILSGDNCHHLVGSRLSLAQAN